MRPLEVATPATGIDVTPRAITALRPHLSAEDKASAVRITVAGFG
jgi:hypothetical protein